jgi:glycosyltransferase involved in cell wall biosynthesis
MQLSVWQLDPAHLTPYYNLALCSALAQADCEVHYATSMFLYDSALLYPTDFQTHFLYFSQSNLLRFFQTSLVRRILRTFQYPIGHYGFLQVLDENPPAIVHIQWARLPHLDQWLIAQLHQRGIPVIYTAHDIEPLFSYVFDLSRIYSAVDAIIAHTNANRNILLQRYPYLSEKALRVIPHLAPAWEVPQKADRDVARSLLEVADAIPLLLFFGSNRAYKSLDVLIEAFIRAREARPDLWLLVAGLSTNSPKLSPLRASHILVKSEYIPSDQVWMYHLAADVVVLPYSQISQSGELITAMSFGLPVIVTEAGGMPETVNENGWVVPINDPVALSEAIIDAFSDMSRLKSLGNRSLQVIQEFHSPSQIVKKTLALYSEIIQCYSGSSTAPTV